MDQNINDIIDDHPDFNNMNILKIDTDDMILKLYLEHNIILETYRIYLKLLLLLQLYYKLLEALTYFKI